MVVAELEPVAGQSKIETRGAVSADGDQPLADGHQLLAELFGAMACGGRALDFAGIASELGAPFVENVVLASQRLNVSEPMPDARVLGRQAERLPLAATADQDRDRSHRRWIQPAEPRPDPRQ